MNKSIHESNFNWIANTKKTVESDTHDYMCNTCFKLKLEMDIFTDTGHQWSNGVIDPSSVQSGINMCNTCFKLELDEHSFSLDGTSSLSCKQCGLCLEKNNELFSAIQGICNHCYLEVANTEHSCIRCDPTFPIPLEAQK
jgi:hypothetical protein